MSVGEDQAVTEVLRRVAGEARPARLPADLWSRGRRRHRWQITVAVAAVAAMVSVVAVPIVTGFGLRRASPAEERPTIPSQVYRPLPLQSTVQEHPAGPAALILTAPGGYGASDIFGYEDRALAVGRNGSYRWVRNINGFDAGESVLLSPDGRYLAGDAGMEGANPDIDWSASTAIVDLTTGQVNTYRAGRPLAWSPTGRTLLTWDGQLSVLSIDTGAVDRLGMYGAGLDDGTPVAFSPDGRNVAMQIGRSLHVIDLVARSGRALIGLDEGRVLAGPGAWLADGRIAVWQLDCAARCQTDQNVILDLTYVDADDGAVAAGPRYETIDARGARLLGWQSDGDAVVVQYREDETKPGAVRQGGAAYVTPWQVTHAVAPIEGRAEVVALHPGGGSEKLIELPGETSRVDVAPDLLDEFGGPPFTFGRFQDWLATLSGELLLVVVLASALYAWFVIRRRIRTGSWRGPYASSRRRVEFPRRF